MKPHAPAEWAARPMGTLDELALFCGGSGTSFTGDLLRLMVKADFPNRVRLAGAFPGENLALRLWQALPAPTFGQLAAEFEQAAAGTRW